MEVYSYGVFLCKSDTHLSFEQLPVVEYGTRGAMFIAPGDFVLKTASDVGKSIYFRSDIVYFIGIVFPNTDVYNSQMLHVLKKSYGFILNSQGRNPGIILDATLEDWVDKKEEYISSLTP